MRGRIVLLFVLALVCAAGAAFLVMKKVQEMRQPTPAEAVAAAPATTPLLVATRDLPTGTVIGPADTRVVQWPTASLPLGGMPPDSIVFGETVVHLPIAQNAPIIDSQILRKGEGGALAYIVPPGRVAMAILVGPQTGVGGHIGPGNRVDVLYVHDIPAEAPGTNGETGYTSVAETLLVGVKVLAVDLGVDDVNPEAHIAQTVTLEVSPKEAEMLLLATDGSGGRAGNLMLSLNSAVEPEPADLLKVADVRRGVIPSFTTQSELSAIYASDLPSAEDEEPTTQSAPQPAAHTVYIFRGNVVQEVSMPTGGRRGGQGVGELLDAAGPPDPASQQEAEGDADDAPATPVPAAVRGAAQGDAATPAPPPKLDLSGGSS